MVLRLSSSKSPRHESFQKLIGSFGRALQAERAPKQKARLTPMHHTPDTTDKIPRNVIMLGIVSLCTDAATEMIYPLIPIFVTALGSGVMILGVIEGVAETTAALLKLFSGIISDKLRKRRVLVAVGYSLSSLVRPLTGLVSSAWQIVFVRMFDRVGKGIRTSPRDALIASSVNERIRGKAYGFHRAMDHTGAVLGPLLALGTLALLVLGFGMTDTVLTLRWTFCLSIIPGIFAVMTILLFVEEKTDSALASAPFTFSLQRFDRNFLAYLSVVLLFTLGNSSDAFLLFRVQEAVHNSGALSSISASIPPLDAVLHRLGDVQAQERLLDILLLPLVWAFFHVIKAAFSTPLGALSDRIGRKLSITIGWGIYAAVYVCFAVLEKLPGSWQVTATFLLFAIYSFYYAFSEAAEKAFVADVVNPEMRGSAFGMYNFAVGLGALPASILFGLLYDAFGATAAFGTGAALACAAMLLLAMLVRERPRPASS
jgi:MFS family permease